MTSLCTCHLFRLLRCLPTFFCVASGGVMLRSHLNPSTYRSLCTFTGEKLKVLVPSAVNELVMVWNVHPSFARACALSLSLCAMFLGSAQREASPSPATASLVHVWAGVHLFSPFPVLFEFTGLTLGRAVLPSIGRDLVSVASRFCVCSGLSCRVRRARAPKRHRWPVIGGPVQRGRRQVARVG